MTNYDLYSDQGLAYPTPDARRAGSYVLNKLVNEPDDEIVVPIYMKNSSIGLVLEQYSHGHLGTSGYEGLEGMVFDVGGFNLHSMTWEGDYNSRNYKRV